MASLEQGRRKRGGWGAFLAKQLTLSQPGGQIIPTTVLQAPPPNFQTLRRAWVKRSLYTLYVVYLYTCATEET